MRIDCTHEPALRQEVHNHRTLRERLLAEFPDLDDETLTDTLEGITDLHEMIAEVIRSSLTDRAMACGLKARIEEMRDRLGRLEARAEKKRGLAFEAMRAAEIPKLEQPDLTATLRRGATSLEVLSEAAIPEAYWKPQPPKLDRKGLLEALKDDAAIPGVALAEPQLTLSVRTR